MKEYPYSEIVALKRYDDLIEVEQCGGDDFVYKGKFPSSEEVARVKAALQKAEEKMTSGEFDLVVLDEALVSIYFRLLNTEDLTEFISEKPENVELILTGRYCPEEIIQLADLVTEMKEVKHYYQKGVQARKGIES
jgi:cob(I)alamin adenosyltransferase